MAISGGNFLSQFNKNKRRRHMTLTLLQPIFILCFGAAIGYSWGLIINHIHMKCFRNFDYGVPQVEDNLGPENDIPFTEDSREDMMLVGIMSARNFLKTRAVAAYETWVQTIPGTVIFFSSEGSEDLLKDEHPEIPVIGLKGIDDVYPPQQKAFHMLEYMYIHYGKRYKWFMRADDDVHVKGDKLSTFLHSVNSSKLQFIGQAGYGEKADKVRLNLGKDQNFCMGGPGVIMSNPTLKHFVNNMDYCSKRLPTLEEDVEIGRCVNMIMGISCTENYEMPYLFYHNYLEPKGAFQESLKRPIVENAMTLHPVKIPSYLYRMHIYLEEKKIKHLKWKIMKLYRERHTVLKYITDFNTIEASSLGMEPSLNKNVPKNKDEVLMWDFFSNKRIFSATNGSQIMEFKGIKKNAARKMGQDLVEITVQRNKQKFSCLSFKNIIYGYTRVNPLHGVDYELNVQLSCKRKHKYKKKRYTYKNYRHHAFCQQSFTELEFAEIEQVSNNTAYIF